MQGHGAVTFLIAALVIVGIVVRPWRLPEAVWAVLGAVVLIGCGLLPWRDALHGLSKGLDVYLFLAGMIVLAELARREGLFDWLAAVAVGYAKGSVQRLFALVYGVAIVVTAFLSNDATAVVLTPAVYAAARRAGVKPLPHLLVCAFVANAASFLLPISNPANLVVFDGRVPQLFAWLRLFLLPSVVAIGATYITLWLTQRTALALERPAPNGARPLLSLQARLCAYGILVTGAILLACSAYDVQLGLPTFACGCGTAALVTAATRRNPAQLLSGGAWTVLPLVAGLFVIVEAIEHTGTIARLAEFLRTAAPHWQLVAWLSGLVAALACNVMTNFPVGVAAGSVLAAGHLPAAVSGAMLIGVDLGPNLSITGSLATILWIIALRREGEDMGALRFLRLGALIMPPALVAALAAAILLG
jgi:arsenical pump membrane protein